ncbi:YagK/YfjJ domain-containing protein [Rhodoferax ferrireducens]|uniref:YagK/YfjJ domain-containing protein n=1 Tax=Rhodoferax ferrireducens TaxID=192843 RepID=UPI000E0DAAC5|nr:inovirus-type Gp2 protein [Rhodoferax ferrireducens]
MSKNDNDDDNSIDISMYDMYNGIDADANMSEFEKDGQTVTVLGADYGNLRIQIEEFVSAIASGNELGFTVVHCDGQRPTVKPLALSKYFTGIKAFMGAYLPNYEFSENVKVFFEACNVMGLDHEQLTCRPLSALPHRRKIEAELFNDLIARIRTTCKSKKFKDQAYSRVYNATRNFRGTKIYIDRLFKRHSRLLAMRVDFGYKKEHASKLSVGDAQGHLKHFFNNMRSNKLFAPLLGYVWRRECGEEKGLHFHVVLFYDGSLTWKDEYIASKIGDYWNNQVTAGKGVFFNCNMDKKNRYKRLGIGMIHAADVDKRRNLLEAVKYLTKKEVIFRPKEEGGFRAFGKGNMPSERNDGPGRPRTVGVPAPDSDTDELDTPTNNFIIR